MSDFALQLREFAAKAGKRADEVIGRTVADLAAEVDRRSPVGDPATWQRKPPPGYVGGHFRGNWQLGVGEIPAGEIPGVDPEGSAAQGRILAAIPNDAAGKMYYLANNAPYARRLEYEGWSHQAAPGFIVGGAVAMFEAIVARAVGAPA